MRQSLHAHPPRLSAATEPLKKLLDKVQDGNSSSPSSRGDGIGRRSDQSAASVSLGYPIGALMLLETGNPDVRFKPRPVEGAPAVTDDPEHLLLDGQQRITSLYQALASDVVVQTLDDHKKPIKRWYYIDIMAALDPSADRDEAIVSVPENRQVRTLHATELDVSTQELEFQHRLFPLRLVFGEHGELRQWLRLFARQGTAEGTDERNKLDHLMDRFDTEVIRTFEGYLVPTIVLRKECPKDAVCQVFEKVNTGGVSLTALNY